MEENKEIVEEKCDDSFKSFIWNPKTKEFCGRTGLSWAQVLVFYLIFYICLAAFWATMMIIFRTTLNENEPKWKLDQSTIGSNPGLGYRPGPPANNIASTLIRFSRNRKDSYQHWVDDLTNFLKAYQNITDEERDTAKRCADEGKAEKEGKFCPFLFQQNRFPGCTPENQFGYKEGQPCVLIKLNRIFDWKPEPFTSKDRDEAREKKKELPKSLTDAMKAVERNDPKVNDGKYGYIYITCRGINNPDSQNIGDLKYLPFQGIRSYYYPFQNQKNYRSPFAFVKFTGIQTGVIVNVQCRAWAKNIDHDPSEREGTVNFEISVE